MRGGRIGEFITDCARDVNWVRYSAEVVATMLFLPGHESGSERQSVPPPNELSWVLKGGARVDLLFLG